MTANHKAIRWFAADGYRELFEQLEVQREIFGHQEKWREWLNRMGAVLAQNAEWARLGIQRRRRPKTIPKWPSPYWLTRRRRYEGRLLPVLVKGNRARLFNVCIVSELEVAARMPPSLDLRVLWSLLWDVDEHAKLFCNIRYRRLLHLPKFEGGLPTS